MSRSNSRQHNPTRLNFARSRQTHPGSTGAAASPLLAGPSRGSARLARLWADVEDHLVPYFRLDPAERCLYYHLLRHTRVLGRRAVALSKRGLSYSSCLSITTINNRMRSLLRKGLVRIVERNHCGHRVDVLVPAEIPGCLPASPAAPDQRPDQANCVNMPKLRMAVFQREFGKCFYCRRQLGPRNSTLDHVVPLSRGGDHSHRNVVACCLDCNTRKKNLSARAFLRQLRRTGRLNRRVWLNRRRALRELLAQSPVPTPRLPNTGARRSFL